MDVRHSGLVQSPIIKESILWLDDAFWFIVSRLLTDKQYLSFRYWTAYHKRINWANPQTFSEKLQWMKLYNRDPQYTILADKVKVKEHVASLIGKEYIIPTIGVWDDPDKIGFDALPEKFVLKCNHNSGTGMYICTDKSKMNVEKVKKELRNGLRENYFYLSREWPYKDVPRRILAEEFIDSEPGLKDLSDYKWYCFSGEPRYCQVIKNRSVKKTIDFYDTDWVHQEFVGLASDAVNSDVPINRPRHLEKQIQIARILSHGIPFSRVDLYEVGDKVYFGEVTFFPTGGFGKFRPKEYDEILGKYIVLDGNKSVK